MKYFYFLFFAVTSMYCQSNLQYSLEKNDVFKIKQNAEQHIVQDIEGATHELTNHIDGILEFKVIENGLTEYKIELRFKDLNMTMKSNLQGELMVINAKEVNEGDIQSKMFNSLLNTPIEMTLAKTGDILRVKGGDSLITKMIRSAGITDAFTSNMMRSSLEKEFGSEALSQSYEQMTYIYPKANVKKGDTWKNEYEGKLNAKNTWTLKAMDQKNAEIVGNAIVVMNIIEPSMTMNLEGSQQTSITTDIKSGFISKMNVEGISKGTSTMPQMGNQEIPTTIKSKITYELITE